MSPEQAKGKLVDKRTADMHGTWTPDGRIAALAFFTFELVAIHAGGDPPLTHAAEVI